MKCLYTGPSFILSMRLYYQKSRAINAVLIPCCMTTGVENLFHRLISRICIDLASLWAIWMNQLITIA